MGFGEQAFAMQFRDTIANICEDVLARLRPPSRYATVIDFSRTSNTCRVQPTGEFQPIIVRMGPTVQPTLAGDVVRIEGQAGNQYIAEVVSGEIYRRNEYTRVQFNMTGGGTIFWDGSTLGWSSRFLAIGGGQTYELVDGYTNIEQPPAGQVVQWHGNVLQPPVLVTSFGVQLLGYATLYYEPGPNSLSVDSNFHMVDFEAPFEVPPNWIMVASVSNSVFDPGSPSLRLGTGEQIDHWRTPTMSGGWVWWGAFDAPGYTMEPGRTVALRGLVKNGANGSANPIFTLPPGYRPSATKIFLGMSTLTTETTGAASAGTAHTHSVPLDDVAIRLEVDTLGRVYTNTTLTSGSYVSLNNIRFRAEL